MTTRHVRVGAIATLTREAESLRADEEYRTLGVLNHGRGLFERPVIRGSETKYPRLFRVRSGQLLYSKLFAWEGSVAIVPDEFDGYFVSPEFPTFDVDCAAVDVAYLGHIIRWQGFDEQLRGATTGLGQRRQRVNVDQFEELVIPLPDLPEQRRIAAHLDGLERGARNVLSRLVATDSRSYLAQIPRFVSTVFEKYSSGSTAARELFDTVNETVHPGCDRGRAARFVGLEHIESHSGRRLGSRPLGDEKGRKLSFRPGDILYGYLRPYLNKAWVADCHGLCSVDQYVLRGKEGVEPELLGYAVRSAAALAQARDLTHSLQLPRLRSGLLLRTHVRIT